MNTHNKDALTEELIVFIRPDEQLPDRITQTLRALDLPLKLHTGYADCLQELRSVDGPIQLCILAPLGGDDLTGLGFQRELGRLPHSSSCVFYTTEPKTRQIVEAMRQGAVAVVELTDDLQRLINFIYEGLERSASQLRCETECRETLEQLRSLNKGEHEVLQGIMAGKLNKEIAHQLNLSIRTIEQRRREVFRKMHVQHPASLARKVISASRATRWPEADDEKRRWLEDVRVDFAHAVVPRVATATSWQR